MANGQGLTLGVLFTISLLIGISITSVDAQLPPTDGWGFDSYPYKWDGTKAEGIIVQRLCMGW